MQLYRCDSTLHDYLFFATTERGKAAETGPFIHNYTLTYALGWASSPWRNDVQKPHYREELAQVGYRYVTPARLVRGSYVVSQYNTMTESYHLGKAQSIGYPDWGFIKTCGLGDPGVHAWGGTNRSLFGAGGAVAGFSPLRENMRT